MLMNPDLIPDEAQKAIDSLDKTLTKAMHSAAKESAVKQASRKVSIGGLQNSHKPVEKVVSGRGYVVTMTNQHMEYMNATKHPNVTSGKHAE